MTHLSGELTGFTTRTTNKASDRNIWHGVRRLIITIVFRWKLGENQKKRYSPEIQLVFCLILREKQKDDFAGVWLSFDLNTDLG